MDLIKSNSFLILFKPEFEATSATSLADLALIYATSLADLALIYAISFVDVACSLPT